MDGVTPTHAALGILTAVNIYELKAILESRERIATVEGEVKEINNK